MNRKALYLLVLYLAVSCSAPPRFNKDVINQAIENGMQANEGYVRSLKFTEAWLTKTDSATGLIPTNLTRAIDIWEPHNSAADNYAFMVLTGYLLDRDLYNDELLDMLKTEQKITSRIKSLPDIYSFSKHGFRDDEVNMGQIIFGTSEYIKDGLIPLTEYIGKSPWQDRMMEMLDDLLPYIHPEKLPDYFERTASVEEVNGEMLQTLSRVYWMTGDQKYLDLATTLGDYYLLGERDLTQTDYLRIRDHGCEIIGGLSELYVTLHFANPEKKEHYKEPYYKSWNVYLKSGETKTGFFTTLSIRKPAKLWMKKLWTTGDMFSMPTIPFGWLIKKRNTAMQS